MQNFLKVNSKRTNQYNQYHHVNMVLKLILHLLKQFDNKTNLKIDKKLRTY